jgi:hypothetical protein
MKRIELHSLTSPTCLSSRCIDESLWAGSALTGPKLHKVCDGTRSISATGFTLCLFAGILKKEVRSVEFMGRVIGYAG